MSYKITDNTQRVGSSIAQKASVFLRYAADEVVNIAQPITPASAKNPRLRNDVLRQVLGLRAIIKWSKAYAGAQEAGKRKTKAGKVIYFKKYTTPGTGPHFAEKSVKEVLRRTQAIARRAGLI